MRTLIVVLSMLLVLAGLVPLADAQSSRTVTGTIASLDTRHSQLTLKQDSGPDLTVYTSQLPADTIKGLHNGDRVTLTVQDDPKRANLVRAQSVGTAAAAPAGGGKWDRIHGQVQSVSGSSLIFKADDGRQLTVDASKVSDSIRNSLQPGTGATVAGHEWTGPNQLRAEFIQKDTGGAAAPSASPTTSGPVDEKSWQRIHGQVQSVSGTQLTLKADDGRTLNVDMKDVNAAVQKALAPGAAVTVVGFLRGDQNNVTARYIQQDSSAK
jgi:outer membrane lipoprotein SlyB/cold shock CspA family protein